MVALSPVLSGYKGQVTVINHHETVVDLMVLGPATQYRKMQLPLETGKDTEIVAFWPMRFRTREGT